jgi:predicted anti-sigma-YlaC factor YlaD
MKPGHLTPERVSQIVQDNRITIHELAHLKTCPSCNGWMRAFASVTSAKGQTVLFNIPSVQPQDSNPN